METLLLLIKPMLIFWSAALPLWIMGRLWVSSRRSNNGNVVSLKRELVLFIFVAYISAVFSITIAPVTMSGISEPVKSPVNFLPVIHTYQFYISTLADPSGVSTAYALGNIIGNLLLFIPFGMMLPCISPKFKKLQNIVTTTFFCSFFIEFCQVILGFFDTYRTADIDDIVLNTLSGVIGWLIFTKIVERYFFRTPYSANYLG